MKWEINEIEQLGLVRIMSVFGNMTDEWYKYIGNFDVYFYYCVRGGKLECRCSDGGDYSHINDDIKTVEQFEELENLLSIQ